VFVLSGVPAAAVACDLLVCSPKAGTVSGCHEHATTVGERAVSAADTCSHLWLVAPFVAPTHRADVSGHFNAALLDVPLQRHALTGSWAESLLTQRLLRGGASTRFQPLRI
jgi:hypothetical protein